VPTILRAPERLTAAQKKAATTLFLAGPFEGDGEDGGSWRDVVIDAFADLDITIFDPRNERWASLEAGSPGRRGAYEWQCAAAFDADVVIVWVPAGSHAPTALMILGYLGAKRSNAKKGSSVVVGGDGWDGLVKLFAQNQRLFPAGDDLGEVIRIARLQIEAAR
jgi:hypothetical protein